METALTQALGIEVPLICGAMYPCSNPELVAAVSAAGGIGIVQPLSLTYVHGWEFRDGLRYIRSLTGKPIGLNLIIERSSKKYLDRARQWLDIALEEDVPFFVTALGDPGWVVDKAHAGGALVYHDVTCRRHGQKAIDAGVDGFICVNNRAGGHAGTLTAEALLEEIGDFGKPMVCAGGISQPEDFAAAVEMGYAGAQLGTRFIATDECTAPDEYKQAILAASEDDIVLTEKISGVPVSVIRTPWLETTGTHAGPAARRLLQGRRTKHWMRTLYSLQSIWKLKRSMRQGMSHQDFFQAGKSVSGIREILPVREVVRRFAEAVR